MAFKLLEDGENVTIGYTFVCCHIIFDVKMEYFLRKARIFAGGHTAETPATMTYASVVSRETVLLDLVITILNDLELNCRDVMNVYITEPIEEKIWTTIGPDFGPDSGKISLVVCDLYGLKSAGAAFYAHLGRCMQGLVYVTCIAYSDLWIKAEVTPDDRYDYYSYIICYVDFIMVIHHAASGVLTHIDKYFTLKPSYIGEPDIYLGTKLIKMTLPNGI